MAPFKTPPVRNSRPHHEDEKDVQFSAAPFGIVGLETTVSLCLDLLVREEVIPLLEEALEGIRRGGRHAARPRQDDRG